MPTPVVRALSIAMRMAIVLGTKPRAPSPSIVAAARASETTRTFGFRLTRPSRARLTQKSTKRAKPCDSMPRRSERSRTSTVISAWSCGTPAATRTRIPRRRSLSTSTRTSLASGTRRRPVHRRVASLGDRLELVAGVEGDAGGVGGQKDHLEALLDVSVGQRRAVRVDAGHLAVLNGRLADVGHHFGVARAVGVVARTEAESLA